MLQSLARYPKTYIHNSNMADISDEWEMVDTEDETLSKNITEAQGADFVSQWCLAEKCKNPLPSNFHTFWNRGITGPLLTKSLTSWRSPVGPTKRDV